MISCRDNKRRSPVRKIYPLINKGEEQSVKTQGNFWLVNNKVIRLSFEKTRSLQKLYQEDYSFETQKSQSTEIRS
jgi:hypothetical protein